MRWTILQIVIGATALPIMGCARIEESESLTGSVVAETVRMPAKDAFGRAVPAPPFRVLSVPCGGCATLDGFLSTAKRGSPLILVSADPDIASHVPEVALKDGARLVADPDGVYVPRAVLDYPPVALKVGPNGRVLAQGASPQEVATFLGAMPEPETAVPFRGVVR